MATSEEQILRETLRGMRKQRIEPLWEKLNEPDQEHYATLWHSLAEVGCTLLALPDEDGGFALSEAAKCEVMRELGAAAPALGAGLVSHLTAHALLREAAGSKFSALIAKLGTHARFALVGSPLDEHLDTGFTLASEGRLSGAQRIALPPVDWLVVPAMRGTRLSLALVARSASGIQFAEQVSSHGLRLIPFGELVLSSVSIEPEHVFDWPMSGRATNQADGMITALLAGIVGEMAERASAYALIRYQGGKMIHEHDAVRQLIGPMHMAVRSLSAIAVSALEEDRSGDGGASAFAVEIVRNCGLDAIQTFGGYGYMEDYRVERYLRDANTLETIWIHAAARQRAIAVNHWNQLSS